MAAWELKVVSTLDGAILCSVNIDSPRVKDIEAVRSGDTLGILVAGETVAVGYPTTAQAEHGEYELLRRPVGSDEEPKATTF